MKMIRIALISCLLVTPLLAQSPVKKIESSTLDQQVASLKVDIPRIREIMKLVATTNDQPTKQIHDEFWGLILTRIHADPAILKRVFLKEMNEGQVVQIEFWKSLRLSAQSHRVVITKEFAKLRNNYTRAEFTSDYTEVQNAMLSAASTGQAYVFRNGQTTRITAKMADKTLAGMDAMKSRMEKLFDPNWQS